MPVRLSEKRCLAPRFGNCGSFFPGVKPRPIAGLSVANVAETEHALASPLNNPEANFGTDNPGSKITNPLNAGQFVDVTHRELAYGRPSRIGSSHLMVW